MAISSHKVIYYQYLTMQLTHAMSTVTHAIHYEVIYCF